MMVLFQILILIAVGQYSFHIDVFSRIGLVLGTVFLLSLFFICLGMIIAILIKNQQTSILTTTFLVLGFFLFSNSIAPLESMPPPATVIAGFNPFTISSIMFTKILIFNVSLNYLMNEILILGGYVIILIMLLSLVSMKKFNLSD